MTETYEVTWHEKTEKPRKENNYLVMTRNGKVMFCYYSYVRGWCTSNGEEFVSAWANVPEAPLHWIT